MYIVFSYTDNSNNYISMNNKNFFKMICKYCITQLDTKYYVIDGKKAFYTIHPEKKTSDYEKKRFFLQMFAQEWQSDFDRFTYTLNDILGYQSFFEEYGKKYGLLREFRENGII